MSFTVADRQDYLLGRERLPQNEAAVFVETRFANTTNFVRNESLDQIITIEEDDKRAQISTELWKQAEAEKTQIFDLMEKVQTRISKKSGKGSQALASADARNATWPQVLAQVGTTAQQWSESRKTSNVSLFIDKIGRNSEAFQGWLQMLPNGDYGSSICGVFSIAISAAGHFNKVEDAIFEGLAEIPEILENAKRYVKIYSETKYSNLEHKTFDLYLSILRALRHVLKFFADSSARHIYEPLLKQSSYQQDLRGSLDNIRKQAERVKEEANQCSQARLEKMDRDLLMYGDLLQHIGDESLQNGTVLQAIYRLLRSQYGQSSDLKENRNVSASVTHKQIVAGAHEERQLKGPPNYAEARRLLRLLRPDMVKTGKDKDKDHGDDEEGTGQEFVQKTEQDVKACLSGEGLMTVPAQSKVVALMGEEKFQGFMDMDGGTGSARLLVNGHKPADEGPSPFSILGAKLYAVAASARQNRPFVLAYFCDEHRPFSKGPSETCKPVGMILSLLGQLVEKMVERGVPVDLSTLEDKRWRMIRKHGVITLGRVFDMLASQLPPGSSVYCVIDEVTHYEQSGMAADLKMVLWWLAATVEAFDKKGKAEFKLLVMTRGEARGVEEVFEGRVVDLPENVEARDSAQTVLGDIGKR